MIQGDAVYLATVYFIKPELICSPGRSKEDFDDQGTGNVLWLKKKDGTFLKAPLEMDDADEGVSNFFLIKYLVQLIKQPILRIPNLRCCKVGFFLCVKSYIGIFGCILVSI